MSNPTPLPPVAGALYWPVDLTRVKIGPRFEGHHATPQNPYRPGYGYHTGVDFLGPMGLRVNSVADGVVVEASTHLNPGYGRCILIFHAARGGWSRYGHLDSMDVKTGDVVRAGQQIGRLGTSGTDNPHLHFDWIDHKLPMTRMNPHNPAVGGVKSPKLGLDPVELALLELYFRNPVAYFNASSAKNPVTLQVTQA